MSIRSRPSPFGGAGGLSGERPPLGATDAEYDAYAEVLYHRRMADFELADSLRVRPRKQRRAFSAFTTKNCEECSGDRS